MGFGHFPLKDLTRHLRIEILFLMDMMRKYEKEIEHSYFFKKRKVLSVVFRNSPFSKQGLAVSRSLGILKIALGDDPLLLGDQPLLDLVRNGWYMFHDLGWFFTPPLKSVDRPINCCLKSLESC